MGLYDCCLSSRHRFMFLFRRTTNNTITSAVRANAGYNSCNSKTTYRVVQPAGYDPAAPWLKVKCSTDWATIAYKSRLTHPRELASSPIIKAAIVIVTAPKRLILCSAQFKNHLLGRSGRIRTYNVSGVTGLQPAAFNHSAHWPITTTEGCHLWSSSWL